jgi:anaphase-promoting complex subunit 1
MDSSQELSTQTSSQIPVPSCRSVSRTSDVVDILKVVDGNHSRMVYLKEGPKAGRRSVWLYAPWSTESFVKIPLLRLRMFNPFDVTREIHSSPRAVGVKRTLDTPEMLEHLENTGPNATLDVLSSDGRNHQIQLQLRPRNEFVSKVIELCRFILPFWVGERLQIIWWNRYRAYGKLLQKEWHALTVSLLSLALALEDDRRSRRSHRRQTASGSASLKPVPDYPSALMTKFESSWNSQTAQNLSTWSWIPDSTTFVTRSPTASPGRRREKHNKNPRARNDHFALGHVTVAREFVKSPEGKDLVGPLRSQFKSVVRTLPKLLIALHFVREELKLNSVSRNSSDSNLLAMVIAQFGRWLGWSEWDWKEGKYYHLELGPTAYNLDDGELVFTVPNTFSLSTTSSPQLFVIMLSLSILS